MNDRHDEEGAALLMALVFLLLFAIAVPALLGFSFSSIRYATTVEDRGRVAYAGDGAVESAIANLRANATLGVEGGPACDSTVNLNGTPVLVRCAPKPGSGAVTTSGGGPASPLNTPSQAIFITGTDTSEIGLDKASNSNVRIGGNVLSRNTVIVQPASLLEVTGDVRASLGCDATRITATGTTHCATPVAAHPTWSPDLAAAPARRTAPACAPGIVARLPGRDDDAAALNALTNGACPGRTIHFAPGAYYFEFTGATREWSMTDPNTTVVGGTLLPAGGDCIPDAPAGVQWVFGADSRIRIHNGKLNLCATPHTDRQRIAIFGLSQSVGVVPSTTLPAATSTTAVTTGWTNVPATAGRNGSELAGDGRHVEIAVKGGETGRVTQTFSMAPLPAGSIVEQAIVRVVHQEAPLNRMADPTLTLAAGTSTTSFTIPASSSQWTTHDLDATAWFAADPSRLSGPNPTLTYSVAGTHISQAGTARLDGIAIVVRYRVAGMNATSGCLLEKFGTGCSLITTLGNPSRLIVRGTIYAPNATLDLLATNQSEQVADRGIVARAMRLSVTASAPVGYQMVSVPTSGGSPPVATTADRNVTLTACPRDTSTGGCAKRGDGSDDVLVSTDVRFPSAGGPAVVVRWLVS